MMSKRFSVDRPMFGDVGSGQRNYGGQVAKSTAETLDERGHNDDQTSSAEKEMQAKAFESIVALLLDAGYYRARIATLSEFDKAVGGLCWAITTSGVNVDVDILFTENATIGEKVQLSEKIIAVMRAMNCPHPLQANQVQGSDWANVLPVMSWLITKTVENRERTALQLKRVVQMQFGKHMAPLQHEDRNPKVDSGLPDVMARYTAKRRCRLLVPQADQGSEASRVHSVLLEYGETLKSRYGLAGGSGSDGAASGAAAGARGVGGDVNANALTFAGVSGSGGDDKQLSAFERKLAAAAKKAALAEAELATATSLEEDALLQSMQTLEGATGNASSKRVGSIVGLGTIQIAAAAARYQESVEEARRKVEELEGGGALGGVAAYRRQKAALEKRAQALQPQVEALSASKRQAEANLQTKTEALAARAAANAAAQARTVELEAQEKVQGQASEMLKLKELVLLNEQLRQQEQSFKANVKRQLGNLNAEVAALEAKEAADAQGNASNSDDARLREIEAMHEKVTAKYARLRQLLAERNLAVSLSSRRIDDVPLRSELIQYEKRFTELYAQVAGKLAENKKYFEACNTLEETKRMLVKEVSLINSIADNFDAAMATKATKESFVAQLAGIIESTDQSLVKQRATLAKKDQTLSALQDTHQSLVDEQREYFKAVKDFQAECTKNELYSAKLQEMASA